MDGNYRRWAAVRSNGLAAYRRPASYRAVSPPPQAAASPAPNWLRGLKAAWSRTPSILAPRETVPLGFYPAGCARPATVGNPPVPVGADGSKVYRLHHHPRSQCGPRWRFSVPAAGLRAFGLPFARTVFERRKGPLVHRYRRNPRCWSEAYRGRRSPCTMRASDRSGGSDSGSPVKVYSRDMSNRLSCELNRACPHCICPLVEIHTERS